MDSYSELTKFLKELKDYKEILTNTQSKLLNSLVQEKREGFPILPAKSDEELKKEIIEGKREQLVLKRGVLKDEIARLVGRTDISQFSKTWSRALSPVFGIGENKDALSLCIDYTLEAVGRLDAERKAAEKARKESLLTDLFEKPEKTTHKTSQKTTEPPKAFIAHEGETKALGKLKTFLDALGVKYLIAEIEPSNGRLVEPQVTGTYGNADFAIILATKGKVIDKQKKNVHYMGMNVADELGRAREVFKNRIILLLETGVQPHTNISGIVYERFKPQSMDNAFIKIAKELRNWGFIRAGKIEE